MDKRSLFYWSREFTKSLKSEKDYLELPDVICINIVDYDFLPTRNYHICFHLREDQEPEIILTNSLEIHYINMIKCYRTFGSRLRKGIRSSLSNDPLIRWLAWLSEHSSLDLVAEVKKMDEAIQMTDDRLVYLSGDEDTIRAYEVRFKAMCDLTSMRNYATRTGHAEGFEKGMVEGMEKGIAEGHEQEKIEIDRKMKEMGDSIERIHAITEPSFETIERL
jgi:predicted transposase/invertase (TIGR01784 family)